MALPEGARLGTYEIRGLLGTGGMGEVYRAWDERLARLVAIKVLPQAAAGDPERLRRFEKEARAAGALNHPNVLAVYDVGAHDSLPYLVAELLEGTTLRTEIRAGALTARRAAEHGVQLARGLAAAHQRGIVHRDLKPENVFLTRDGYVKILDFGLAKLRDDALGASDSDTATPQTRPGVVLGTVPYLSPEQVRGLPADARSDIFALGAVLYEMLAGRRPFTGETRAEIEAAILRADPLDLTAIDRGVSPALDRVVRRCLEKRPEDRFQTAQDVAFALEAVGPGITSTSAGPATEAAGHRPLRVPLALVAALLVGLALGALLLAALRPQPSAPVYTELTFRRGAVLSARFAHDGQTVVYSAAWDGQPAQVFATRIGTGETRALDLEGVVLSVSAKDEVAVKRGRFLGRRSAGQPDGGTLAVVSLAGGAPRDLLDDVFAADWDAEGRELAVARRVEGKKRLEYPIGHVVSGLGFNLRMLPDGRFLMWSSRDAGAVGSSVYDLTLVDGAGRKSVLSSGWSDWPNLSWSESTQEIVFVSARSDALALRAVDLRGHERVVARLPGQFDQHDVDPRGRILIEQLFSNGALLALAPGETQERNVSFGWLEPADLSADGRRLLLSAWVGGLYLRGTDGSPAVRLGDYRGLALSPDGRWVLAQPGGRDYTDHLLVVPTGAGETRELRHPLASEGRTAAWLPDGKRFVLVNGAGPQPHQLMLWDVEMSTPPQVLASDVGVARPVVSPDGRTVVATVQGLGPVVHRVDGGPSAPVPGGAPQDEPLQFTSDGRWLFVRRTSTYSPNVARVWVDRIELASGRRVPWKELRPADPAGASAIGPILVTPDGRSHAYSVISWLRQLFLVEGLR